MDAEDLLQEGFIKVFNNLHQFRGEGSFEGWVKRIFITTCIGYLRSKKIDIKGLEEFEDKIIDTYKNAFDELCRKDIIKSSYELSVGYRTVFHLYAVEGYSHKEIADQLGIKESTSKSQFSRAKAVLTHKIKNIPVAKRS
jgi:RNA polymerase sigma-70 factor (ECF subfamily)